MYSWQGERERCVAPHLIPSLSLHHRRITSRLTRVSEGDRGRGKKEEEGRRPPSPIDWKIDRDVKGRSAAAAAERLREGEEEERPIYTAPLG